MRREEVAAPWATNVRERTLRSLSLDETSFSSDLKLRVQHWDGTVGDLTLASALAGKLEIIRRDSGEKIFFASALDVVDAGWATTGPVIEPWKGSLWGKSDGAFGGLKLLVLGESSHSAEIPIGEAPTGYTIETVLRFLSGDDIHFHSRVTQIISAVANVNPKERQLIWNSICFANVVPVIAAQYSGERPSSALFHLSSPYLEDLLERLKPQATMIFSKQAWRWFNWALVHRRAEWTQEIEAPSRIMGIETGWTKHPRSMNADHAKDMLAQVLDLARRTST